MSEVELGPPVSVTGQGSFTPTVTVGTTISGVRRVVCTTQTGGISNELTLLTSTGGPKGEMDKLNEIDSRLRTVEIELAGVKERLNHLPTTAQLWKGLAITGGSALAAIAGGVAWLVQEYLKPILAAAGT